MATSIDVEDETILTSVFKDAFPESWRSNPDFAMYLAELSSFGIEKLGREPERLADERSQVLQQTQELAFHNYKTFIQTADCSREIVEDFTEVEEHVTLLLDKLPEFSDQCNNFMKEAHQISNSRRMNSLTLSKYTQLLEILEIPQLMDTCVRNAYYDEALELAGYVRRLEKKHINIPIIKDIVSEVHNSRQLMLSQLLQQLRSSIQLPACLRLIGYLRRMDLFTEAELRIKFLQARDAWFQGILTTIPTDDAYQHITKVIEASRVHLFDIITQYRAIFSDDDPLLSTNKESPTNEAALFQGWVGQKVSQFLQTLKHDLEKGVGNRLDSLLGQCMYFGLSFSRVGADFRGLLGPVFQETALKTFVSAVNEATEKFVVTMHSYTPVVSSAWLSSSVVTGAVMQGDQSLSPPMSLMDHPPLAVYTNQILTAFNELRLCAPLALVEDITVTLTNSLKQLVETIVSYHRAEESTFSTRESEQFSAFCETMAGQLVPYLSRCLQALFPQTMIAQLLGLTVAELQKWGSVGVLNVQDTIKAMDHLLPQKESEEEQGDHEEQHGTPLLESDPVSSIVTSEIISKVGSPKRVKFSLDGQDNDSPRPSHGDEDARVQGGPTRDEGGTEEPSGGMTEQENDGTTTQQTDGMMDQRLEEMTTQQTKQEKDIPTTHLGQNQNNSTEEGEADGVADEGGGETWSEDQGWGGGKGNDGWGDFDMEGGEDNDETVQSTMKTNDEDDNVDDMKLKKKD